MILPSLFNKHLWLGKCFALGASARLCLRPALAVRTGGRWETLSMPLWRLHCHVWYTSISLISLSICRICLAHLISMSLPVLLLVISCQRSTAKIIYSYPINVTTHTNTQIFTCLKFYTCHNVPCLVVLLSKTFLSFHVYVVILRKAVRRQEMERHHVLFVLDVGAVLIAFRDQCCRLTSERRVKRRNHYKSSVLCISSIVFTSWTLCRSSKALPPLELLLFKSVKEVHQRLRCQVLRI